MDRVAFVNAVNGILRLPTSSSSSTFVRRLPSRLSPRPALFARDLRPKCSTASSNSAAQSTEQVKSKGKKKGKEDTSIYSSTVNLPQTSFEQRANAVKREPQLQSFWAENQVYERLSRENPGDTFVLHDGPPFANGPIHCGHALNKILKDFINKHALMIGKRAVFIPGWDTHGLPIELKVLQSIKSKERRNLSTLQLRKRAREFAQETVTKHIMGMKRFGVWGDWDTPYLTMQPEYEAAQMEVFGRMYELGYVSRGKKPVHWSPSSRTALAEAELEYPEGHTSRSCYCAFDVQHLPSNVSDSLKRAFASDSGLALSIWTTTPWTLPANRAVAVNTNLDYALVTGLHPEKPNLSIIIANALVSKVAGKFGTEEGVKSIMVVKGSELVGIRYKHPLQQGLECKVVEGGDYITTDSGTGLVHTAPGHGQEDYQTGLREGLELASPVDDAGKFTDEAADGKFTGMPVLTDGTEAVLETIKEDGVLMLEEEYSHKYPYDWRTKKPTIFRATEQWFVSIDAFRQNVLDEIERVEWFPASGVKRIRGMVEGRGDWCISRQRSWGVPIPVFFDDEDGGKSIMTADVVKHVASVVRKRGTDAWWELDADELLPPEYRGRGLRKGTDTMDVWFDSGSSWAAVAKQRPQLSYPVDIYLEGSDQHRGWFQSSMLTSVATQGIAPYRKVLTHGFVLDEKGVKMSKSIGNVIDPMSVIEGGNNKKRDPAYGADVLRLWVCSVDYSADIMIGPLIMKQVSDVYKKIRNTLRYMAGNISDFNPDLHAIPYQQLPSLDKYMLSRMARLCEEVDDAYNTFSYFKVYQAAQRFAVVELSNFYLDIAKDRLYIPAPDSFRRRSCQTVIRLILENYTRALAPIIPHTTEDLWQSLTNESESPSAKSIFENGWLQISDEWRRGDESETGIRDEIVDTWEIVLDVRDCVNKVLETARVAKTLGAPMEASVKVFAKNERDAKMLKALEEQSKIDDHDVDSLLRALIVSEASIVDTEQEVLTCTHHNGEGDPEDSERFLVGLDKCVTPKCDRCWHYDDTVGSSNNHPLICNRCEEAVVAMGFDQAPATPAVSAAANV